jgi:dTDP-glucose 4,6-dehydratase
VSDLVEGIYRLFASDRSEPTNIGNPNEFTVKALAERVLQLTGARSKLVERPLPTDDPKVRQPDISVARQVLKWEPQVSLDEGLERTIGFFRAQLAA